VRCYLPRIRDFLTEDATKLLVQTLVLSRLKYCSSVWGGVQEKDLLKLQKMVNFAARVIYRRRRYDHVSPLLRSLNWLSVENRLAFDTACFMYKVAHRLFPENISALFKHIMSV